MIQASQPVPGTSRIGGGPAVFMLKALPAAMVLVFSTPGWAIDGAAGLPQNGVVFSGAATGSVSGNQLTINQATARAVVDWASFNIDAGKAVLFVQPNAASAMLNRVTGDANPSQILGSLSANGTVMLMNPNGVMFGQGAVVNVGSLIATTGNIDVNNFINTGGAVITGAVGSIGNQGAITAQNAGLVALVAPSVTNQGSIAAILKAGLDASGAAVGTSNGDAPAAIAASARKIEAVYSYPFQNHATMEPMNATARWTPTRCEVWAPTQNAEAALAACSEAAELKQNQCDVYRMHLGGGFGRRSATDYITQAVRIAKQMPGTPIKLLWSREEDMTQGRYHPVTQCKLTAGLDAQGNVTGLHMRISGQSILASVIPQAVVNGKDPAVFMGLNAGGPEGAIGYSFPNLLIDHSMRNTHVPPGFWRGVNLNQNAIYLESFMDEIALATKQDPLEFRRKMMGKNPKHLAVLNAAAERAGWGKPLEKGHFQGIAQIMGFGSYVAAVAEVSVSDEGKLTVHRIVAATDCGHAVNPQQIEAQVEGSFVYGLSGALYGECTVKDGQIEQENFNTYQMLKMDEMPKVETVIAASGGFWGGVGEPTIAVAAPAVLNAIYAATGKRIRDMPLKNQSLKKA